jgi:hypothetical protein
MVLYNGLHVIVLLVETGWSRQRNRVPVPMSDERDGEYLVSQLVIPGYIVLVH